MLLSRLRSRVPLRPSVLTLRSCSAHAASPDKAGAAVRVRYAPSPTGYLHLGGLRTALFNYLFAKSSGGQFILRIEDTDKTRQVEGSLEALVDSLKWCGVEEDEGPNVGGPYGPYIQSQRLPIYQEVAEKLVESGHAYRCFCSSERLHKLRESQTRHGEATMYDRACLGLEEKEVEARAARGEPHTIRLKIPEGKTVVKDLLRGYVQFDHAGIDDQVLMKSDGYPTYHLANVVDDHAMHISHVIRGEEWLPSTPKHVILYKALGYEPPTWAHLGLLLNEDRSKLSKRQGDVAVEDFRDKGFLPSGLVNFVALLGWNPAGGNNQEIFQMKELMKHFSIDHVNKAGSVVNVDRLRWINSRHVRALFAEETAADEHKLAVANDVLSMISSTLEEGGVSSAPADLVDKFGVDYVWRAMDLMKVRYEAIHNMERVSALPEFGPLCIPFFTNPDLNSSVAQDMKAKYIDESTPDLVADVCANLSNLSDEEFTADHITKSIKAVAKSRKLGLKKVLMPIRYYLTGMDVGAGLGDTIELLGRETILRRLKLE
ncbi:Glutamyl-tRNA synthetase [Phytophthora pseudosyringae]|uniref:glutamate--tRNA ligase n=1 Tax=Phytophthora pseudosyringae TaxID=221518 RepID=A0A8T1WDK1_9STRA|nr:Glutamyl-tRNA synthetase [Phytophthora pseudosyringae]